MKCIRIVVANGAGGSAFVLVGVVPVGFSLAVAGVAEGAVGGEMV